MRNLSKEQWMAAGLAVAITVAGLGYFVKQQNDLSAAAKEGRAKRMADIEALNGPAPAPAKR